MTENPNLTHALAARRAGLNVVPPREDGSKSPEGNWARWQTTPVTEDDLVRWYANGRTGIGLICGPVSGGLEMLEFEARAVDDGLPRQFIDAADAAGLADLLDRVGAGYLEETPSGGLHLLYRCEEVDGNQKLARRPATAEELVDNPDDKIKVLLETRGRGGFVIVAPSNGTVHPSGRPWKLIQGGFDSITTITPEERTQLLRLARTFDRMPTNSVSRSETNSMSKKATKAEGWEVRPGDDYADKTSWKEILEPEGWVPVYERNGETFWRRPGKTRGVSATTNRDGSGNLFVFSSSTVFEAEKPYTAFGAYARLHHGDDYKAAALALEAEGFGRRADPDGEEDHHEHGGDHGGEDHVPAVVLPAPNQPIAVARVLAEEHYAHPGGPLLRFWRGSFWRWVRSHWLEDEEAHLRSAAYRFTEHATYIDVVGKDKERVVKPWAPNRYKVADLLDALRAVSHLPETIDQPAWLEGRDGPSPTEIVACSNGLLHVPTRELTGHTPRLFNRVAVPFPYDPEPAAPTRWLAFLDQLWPDDPAAIAALQEWFGYCISGRTDLHKILLLIGPTRAGKGVIARILAALLGRGNVAGPTLASLGQNFGLQDLVGKPLAVIADARLGGANTHQVVERLLSISGEDMLTIDRKYRDPWTGKLPTRFVVISNELPRFGDASGAIAYRFVVLTCHTSWLGKENPGLTEELLTEMPGILAWALDGVDSLRANGKFTEPSSSTDAITTLLDTVSPTSAFVRDRCTVDPISECPVDVLYAAWKRWCEDNGIDRPGTKQTFGRNLRAVVPSLRVVRPRDGDDRERHYIGLTLRTGPQ